MSMSSRVDALEKRVLMINDESLPDAVIIGVVDGRHDAGPDMPISTLSSGKTVYSRHDGESFTDFKARAVKSVREKMQSGAIPCLIANGSLEI